jgi:hypothetical protein
MRRSLAFGVPLALAFAFSAALPARAKEKAPPRLRYAHSYAEAFEEAKDRSCVIVATFHGDT